MSYSAVILPLKWVKEKKKNDYFMGWGDARNHTEQKGKKHNSLYVYLPPRYHLSSKYIKDRPEGNAFVQLPFIIS